MKTLKYVTFFSTLLLFSAPLYSDVGQDSWALEDISNPKKQPGPFRVEGEFDTIAKARINKEGFHHQKLSLSNWQGAIGMAFCYFPKEREAYAAGVSYNFTRLCWNENPYFHQKNFNEVSFLLRLFSNRFCDWVWQGELAINVDADYWDLNDYMNYDIVLWGRHTYNDYINLHIGAIVQTGMKMDRVYPVIGFDYTISKCWQLNAVFPVNISLEYKYTSNLSAAFAMRFFDLRYRTGRNEPLSRGLFSYRDSGLEFALLYEEDPTLEANIHAGYTCGGMLRISNRHNKHPKHFRLDPAPYVGGELVWSF